MDLSEFITPTNEKQRTVDGNRFNFQRTLYTMNWTSCVIGLVTGCVATIFMTISIMLIIVPYISGIDSIKGYDIWADYGPWQWDSCSVTCGHGVQQGKRSRRCLSQTACIGNETESMRKPCISAHCKVDGQWSDWFSGGECTVTCGEGIQIQTRECSNPYPQYGGKQCEGESYKAVKCKQPECCPGQVALVSSSLTSCAGGWIRNDAFFSCYCFSNTTATWYSAQNYCKTANGILAAIYSEEENDWLKQKVDRLIGSSAWIGGKKVRNEYRWILPTGTGYMNFSRWAPNEPYYNNEKYICVQLWSSQDYKWDDFDCQGKRYYVCKGKI